VYIRGQAEDFDHWRQLGNAGWSYDDVLPYFRRAEHQTRGADDFHGTEGPLCVSDVPDHHPICQAFIDAAVALGFPHNDDFNGAKQEGVGWHQTTTRNGRRCSTAVGYLRPAMRRPNLRVVIEALTEQILFEGNRAVGVAFRRGGQTQTARAREIILCGGAVNSPQLLMLSGIGPQQRLGELGIPVVHHLPGVGQSLQDHYSAPLKLKCKLPITVNDVMLSNIKKLRVGVEYYLFRKGPLAMCTSPAALFARTRPELASPDVKLSIQPFSADRPQDGLHPWSGFSTIVYQLRPESRGYITIKSANPADPPAVHPNYLSTETDQRTIVDGLNLCRRILEQPQFRPFLELEILPGAGVRSDDELLAFARQRGGTVFHPTSTCKMGVDSMAVVDPELRVRGIDGLRVADASVMPTVVSGNTNAATIMIGERAADFARQNIRLAA
jgi:choline dehydrogenase